MNKKYKWLFEVFAAILTIVLLVVVIEAVYNFVVEIITEPLQYSWYEINPPPDEKGPCYMMIIEPTYLQRYYRKTIACIESQREASNIGYSKVMWEEFDIPDEEGPCYRIIFEFDTFIEGQSVGLRYICP